MWIVKTLGRRTRNGVDRVYSVNGAFITQDLEKAAEEAIEVFKDEMRATYDLLPAYPVIKNINPDIRPQDRPEYWAGAWKPEWAL